MNADPVLEGLIAAGAFAIAADRYEEETGDTELATLMRIPGLEWELVDGKPALRMIVAVKNHGDQFGWWQLFCGTQDFGIVGEYLEPEPLVQLPIQQLLRDAKLGEGLASRFYQLYCEAVFRECPP